MTRFLLLLSFACSLIFLVKAASDICQNKEAAKKAILCVGMLRKSLLMVTKPENKSKDQLVYDLPLDSINGSMDKLYIGDDRPLTIREKWPELYYSHLYANVTFGNKIYNSFVALDKDREYLLFTTKTSSNFPGFVYDFKSKDVFRGLSYKDDTGPRQVIISSHQLNKFYAIRKATNNGLEIMRYHWAKDSVKESCDEGDSIIPDETGSWYPICKSGNDSLMIFHEGKGTTSSCEPLLWTKDEDMLKGFVTEGKFYLFSDNDIYVLPSQFYETPNTPHTYQLVQYANFIECSVNVIPKGAAGTSIGVIVAIVLLVLVFVLIACLMCVREVKKRRKHKKKKVKKPQVSAMPDVVSVRSANISNVGDIDGKLSAIAPVADSAVSATVTGRSGYTSLKDDPISGISNPLTGRSGASGTPGDGGGISSPNQSTALSNMVTGRSGASTVGVSNQSTALSNTVTGRSGASTGGVSNQSTVLSSMATGRSGASAVSTAGGSKHNSAVSTGGSPKTNMTPKVGSTATSAISKQVTQRSHNS